jgi:hypothetical protein
MFLFTNPKSKIMPSIKSIFFLISIFVMASCSKDEFKNEGYPFPIVVTAPAENSSTLLTSQPLVYNATFTIDTIIDSAVVSYYLETTSAISPDKSKLKFYKSYVFMDKKSIQSISGVMIYPNGEVPKVGNKLYLHFELFYRKRTHEKWINVLYL